MISKIKDGIHVVAIDDAPHERGQVTTELFFVYCKGIYLERVTHSTISVDGTDATDVILEELSLNTKNFTLIILHGITVGGLNIVDIKYLCEQLQKPVLAVTENPPTQNSIFTAINSIENSDLKKNLVTKAGPLFSNLTVKGSVPIFYHAYGISEDVAKEFFTKFSLRSRLPEPLLLAHKIATAWK